MTNPNFVSETFSENELTAARQLAVRAAMLVGPMLAQNLGAQRREKITNGIVGSLTDWDLRAQDEIIDVLADFDETVGIHAEEDNVTTDKKRYWTIDPIDGTLHYSRANGDKCHTAIALVENRGCRTCVPSHEVAIPVVSVIYNFANDRLFTADSNSQSIKTENASSVTSSWQALRVGVSDHVYELYTDTLDVAHQIENRLDRALGAVTIRNISSSLSMVNIAEGKQDGLIILDNRFTGVQDIAPGSLLVARAGGNVHTIGKPCFSINDSASRCGIGDKIIASKATSVSELLETI